MKIAMPYWQGRVSPVLDVAARFLLITLEHGQETTREDVSFEASRPLERVRQLSRLGAETVICGAISRPLELDLRSAGIQVIAHICGPMDDVLGAFVNGRLNEDVYLMPGCCGRRQGLRVGGGQGGRCRTQRQKGGGDNAQRRRNRSAQ